MKPSLSLLACLILAVIGTEAFAAAPATNAAPAAAKKEGNAPAPLAAPAPAPFKLEDYIKELTAELKLSDTEKKNVQTYYVEDGAALKNILNSDTLSPYQQAQQVADLRSARNEKIEALLQDVDRRHAFLQIEAKYRVALTELAADGGLVAAQPPPAAPAPSDVAPGQAEPAPNAKP